MRSTREHLMMNFAVEVSRRSTCSRAQVGTVITNLEMTQVLAFGYNGNFRGGPNECDHPSAVGYCGCIHSEANALVKAPYAPDELRMFVTMSPCVTCAKMILNASIPLVYYRQPYRDSSGLQLLLDNNVTVIHFPGASRE